MFGGITHFNWAQDSSDLLDIYELKISNEESVYSPNWIKGSDEIGEIIVVTMLRSERECFTSPHLFLLRLVCSGRAEHKQDRHEAERATRALQYSGLCLLLPYVWV